MTTTKKILAAVIFTLSVHSSFAADAAQMTQGQKIYESNCAACHGKKGEGRGTMFPPLYQSDYIMKKPQVLLQSMTKGINGPIKVNGKPYNGFMPATAINDTDLAAVATYIMNAFNNGGGTITEKDAKQAKAKK
ncbi:MAG: cytochrome c [Neisseria sp.]|jgi:cytochrome c family protein|uniref:c-type cytochrome n=1 Tax=unclassified Neisseria TaxID=2623750 RepID=UPI000665381B|nr:MULTISPECIES: cytochrome c [unclassified Neisseria]MDU1534911.1 cytochrome c [Neisseria sp.]OFL97437.1 cytochrome C [Neisseria sp. HMSC074B07]OFN30946.1 cytochrome C [Neisseria sp. HMSC077D05]